MAAPGCGLESQAARSLHPSRFKATTLPVATRRVNKPCACSMAATPGVACVLPMQASTNEGAGAVSCARRGRYRHRGCCSSHLSASSRVRRGFCFWRQCAARAAWSCSAVKMIPRFPSWEECCYSIFAKMLTEAAKVHAAFRQRKLRITVVPQFTVLRKML